MTRPRLRRSLSIYEKVLLFLFLLSLPVVNPWVRGDGVGYYAYIRSLLIDGDLHFENEWRAGNSSFLMNRVDETGKLKPDQFTSTGYVGNHFSVGPAILWAPFLVAVHLLVLALDSFGANIPATGYSLPYTVTMAMATALYAFVGLYLAFKLARVYFEERWAFWGTLGIWFASSLPVYMYFNPSWSHAHSAFTVSLFLWYWHRTRAKRTHAHWIILGVISGVMLNVYYANGVFLLIPLLELLTAFWRAPAHNWPALRRLLSVNLLYAIAVVVAFLPTLITRKILYGSPLRSGAYTEMHWNLVSPALLDVLFSSNHGLLTWTPILIPAVLGLARLLKRDRELAAYFIVCSLAFYYVIASYPFWAGISSFGNRFFVSLTPVFVVGLTASLSRVEEWWQRGRVSWTVARVAVALFIVWNLGFIFQWGTHLVPARGPISWKVMVHNQLAVVPGKLFQTAKSYLLEREALMGRIEQKDVEQLQQQDFPSR